MNARLYIVGLGVNVPGHVTREATDVLSQCQLVFSIVQEPPEVWLPASARNVPVHNLLEMYVEGALRTDNYQRVSARIWEALRDTPAVAYVTYGNPLAYDSVAQQLANEAMRHGVDLRVVPGISSIDTLLCDLRRDMAPGLQVYEASWLVAERITLNVAVPAILVQLGAFGSWRAQYRVPPPSTVLKPLEKYLCLVYPSGHEVFLVRSGNDNAPARVRPVALRDLTTVEGADFLGASMYIPAVRPAGVNAGVEPQALPARHP